MELTGMCMKCRDGNNQPVKNRLMKDIKVEQNAKGRFMARAHCTVCGGNMFKFLSKEDAEKLKA